MRLVTGILLLAAALSLPREMMAGDPAPAGASLGPLVRVSPDLLGSETPKVPAILVLAHRYYDLAVPQMENDLRAEFARLINWPVTFDGARPDAAHASQLTNEIAVAVSFSDAKNFYLASAAAAFALNPANSTGAGNFATAILTYGEDTLEAMLPSPEKNRQLQSYRDDAVAIFRYALSLNFTAKFANEANALPLLINLGNVYIDLAQPEKARVAFQEALRLSPRSPPAHEGMAAYYLATGRKDLAAKEIQRPACFPSSRRKAAEAGEKAKEETAPTAQDGDSEEQLAAKIAQLQKIEPPTMADFIEELDQSGANKLRFFVRQLAIEATYHAPDLHDLWQYGSLEAFSRPEARAVFEEWAAKWGKRKLGSLAARNASNQVDVLKSLGVKLDFGVDLEDVARNPEKYEDVDFDVKVSGLENLDAMLPQLEALEKQANRELPTTKMNAVMQVDRLMKGGMSIYALDPGDYANPSDVFIQKFNMLELNKKLLAYQRYLRKVTEDLRRVLENARKSAPQELRRIEDTMARTMRQIEKLADEEHWSDEKTLLERHHVHGSYFPQLNQVAGAAWLQSTGYANAVYREKLKPNLEAMFNDCFRHVMLISDPEIRTRKETELSAALSGFVALSLTCVSQAYDTGEYLDSWDCDCTIEALAQAREREQEAYDQATEQARQKNKLAIKDFNEGAIPETSGLYKKLDTYSSSFSSPFVDAKWGIVKSSLKFKVGGKDKAHGAKAETSVEVAWDHMRNKTTVTAGLEAAQKVEFADGRIGVEGKVWTKAVVTMDSDSLAAQDWDVAAGANLTGSVGTGSTAAGSANLQGTVAYETSVMRGNTLSAEVAVVGAATIIGKDDAKEGYGVSLPKKLTLWSGKYTSE